MINEFTKGGQTIFQSFRMFTAIFSKLLVVFITITIILFSLFFYLETTSYQRYKAFMLIETPLCQYQ